jgi:hypothetical protein
MSAAARIPMVRCHLDGPVEMSARLLRYVPLEAFGLWQHLMETRHGRQVTVEGVSEWLPEESLIEAAAELESEALEPVLRVSFEQPAPVGLAVTVERFLPAETYPEALDALLSHFRAVGKVLATPGYFVPARQPAGV